MPNKLEDLKITKVDFVDAGANPKANISIYKRAQSDTETTEKIGTSLAKSLGVSKEELQTALVDMVGTAFSEVLKSANVTLLNADQPKVEATTNSPIPSTSENVGKTKADKDKKADEPIPDTPEETTEKEVDEEFEDEEKCRAKKTIKKGANSMECNMTEAEKVILEGLMSRMDSSERMFLQKLILRNATGGDTAGDVQKNSKEPESSKNDDVSKSAEETPPKVETPTTEEVNKNMSDGTTKLMKILSTVTQNLQGKIEKMETNEFVSIAKKYEILGVNAEEFAPMLKSAKVENEQIYNLAITTLDNALTAVEKSGIFTEVGKSGYASTASAEADLQAAAAEIRKAHPEMTVAKSIDKVFQERPDLRTAFDR